MEKKNEIIEVNDRDISALIENSIDLIDFARNSVVKQINVVQIMTYYALGKWIVEYQQNGKTRAQYGKKVIKLLSASLTEKYGKGFLRRTWRKHENFI